MTSHPFDGQARDGSPVARLRPRDAATLVLIDRENKTPRVLVGRRGGGHVFMPDFFVFPGGRRDRGDSRGAILKDLRPEVLHRVAQARTDEAALRRARALAVAAIRELHEETGLVLGRLVRRRGKALIEADLSSLRYIARAVTPPGNVRRFDTHFFCTFADEAGIDPAAARASAELIDLQWLDIAEISGLKLPAITRTILQDVRTQMSIDPALPYDSSGVFYYQRHGRHYRGSI